jgi:Fe-S cluster assembly scaffold protein SufB
MKKIDIENKTAIISYTIEENTTKSNPFYLQNLMYDLPFDVDFIESMVIKITVPKNMPAYVIDDLHFSKTTKNKVEFFVKKDSTLTYKMFVANHEMCNLCDRKDFFDCQTLPENFEKILEINLEEENASAYINCHYLGDKHSLFKLISTQNHTADNTLSKLVVKSVLDGESKFETNNTIFVDKDLKNVTAEEENKNLVLSDKAHVITIPKLKINSNDVSCRHGATVSTLGEKDLFYLQSRGIEKIDAQRTLIEAFLRL